jgi:carboxyl-terminal processing protease
MAQSRRSLFLIPSVVILCSLLGGIYGPSVEGAAALTEEEDIKASLRTFARVYTVVEENAATPVTPDRAIYKGAIPGMLRSLDPHSSFFDPRDFQLLREDQKGHYFGVGMQIGPDRNHRSGKTIVIAPFTGSPAYKAGIRPGDTILAVDDKPVDGLSLTEIADILKGPRGTKVKVSIGREGSSEPLEFVLVRDEIPRKSVEDAFWLAPGIAYLGIQSFTETTGREVDENLKRIGENQIQGLILDLRSNPGGLLTEGVAVADRFLQKGQTIVSHRGRASAEKPYVARRGSTQTYPIVVLVDRFSASAAEIVSGALQDHDRAWILGDTTFGKGLVQTVYPLSENTGLALTTAKYYTPSNRLIQREYAHMSFFDYYFRKGETRNPEDVKMTDSGRTVYGGGGITPDEKYDGPKLNRFQVELRNKYAFFNFTSRYLGTRNPNLPKNWEPDQSIQNEFHQYLLDEGFSFTEAEFAEANDWIKLQLKLAIYSSAFGMDDARRLTIETDPAVAKAVESLPKAKALLESAKRVVAQRAAQQD